MIDNKIFSGGKLNVDDDYHLLPKGDWVDARNVRINSSVDGYLGSFVNIKGTQFLNSPTPIGDNDIVTGARGFDVVNKIFYFTCDPIGNYDRIIEYNATDNTFRVLVENLTDTGGIDILNFSESRDFQINHISLVDGKYLFWTDNLNAPRMIDIDKAYGVITEQSLSVIKYAPTESPTTPFSINNPTVVDNKVKNKNYQIRYRWIYWDNSKSSFSPISKMTNTMTRAVGSLSIGLAEWYDSSLIFGYLGGGDLVKGVELIAREGNTGDWVLIDSFDYDKYDSRISYGARFSFTGQAQMYDMSLTYNGTTYSFGGTYTPSLTFNIYDQIKTNFDALGITDITCTVTKAGLNDLSPDQFLTFTSVNKNVEFTIFTTYPQFSTVVQTGYLQDNQGYNTYVFANYQPLSPIDQAEANRPFDYVPLKAESMTLPNGNYLAYGNYVEGYDNIDIEATAVLNTVALPTPDFSVRVTYTSTTTNFNFFGDAVDGDIFFTTRYEPNDGEYTYAIPKQPNETSGEFVRRIAYLLGLYYEGAARITTISDTGFVVLGSAGLLRRYLAEILTTTTKEGLKSSDEYQYGVVYIDAAGRYGAVQTSSTMNVKSDSLSRFGADPNILNGKITIKSRPPAWATRYAIVRTKRKKRDFFLQLFVNTITFSAEGAKIDVQGAISKYNERYGTNISYSWVAGDRIRFVYQDLLINGGDYVVADTAILSIDADGNLVTTRDSIPRVTGGPDNGFCEIYRFSADNDANLFWELGEFGVVGNPGEANCYHQRIYTVTGNISQSASDPSGEPLVHLCDTGDVWYKYRYLPIPINLEPITGTFYQPVWCESPSFSDFNSDAFTTDVGRANIQNVFEQQTRYTATVRFSLGYLAGTQINNINVFYEENYRDYSALFGPIQVLDVDGSSLIVGQQLRMGMVQIFQSLLTDNNNTQVVSISDQLLSSTCLYYDYEAGIGNSPESYVRYGSSKYFIDKGRGIVCRLAKNGITPISVNAKMNSYFVSALTPASYINTGFDPANNEYVITIRGNDTILFSDNSNGFTSFLDIMPTRYATLRQNIYSFELTRLYKLNATTEYNKFFDNQYDSTITIVSNDSPTIKKSFVAVSEIANDLWDIPEITTDLSQESRLSANKFARLEGEYHASFMRDASVTPGVTDPLFNGNKLKGKWIKLKMKNSNTDFVYLLSVGVKSIISPQTGV